MYVRTYISTCMYYVQACFSVISVISVISDHIKIILVDTSDSQISTDVVEEDDNPSDNEDHSTDLSDEEEEESMVLDLEEDEVLEDRENVTGQDEVRLENNHMTIT